MLIPLAAVLLPYASYSDTDPSYHRQVPMVALGGLLFALWLLGYVRALPGVAVLVTNTVLVVLPLADDQRVPVSVAAAVGLLYVLLEARPSGLLPPEPTAASDSPGSPPPPAS